MLILFVILIAVISALIICCFIERQIIITRRQNISFENLPPAFNNLKIMQISDIHHRKFGENQKRILKRVKKSSPDVIVITGDLISRDMRDFSKAGNFCKSLGKIAPVLFSIGNHELDLPDKVRRTYIETLKSAGVHVLLNSSYPLHKDDEVIYFKGASLDISVYHDENHSYENLNSYSLKELESDIGTYNGFTILLAHNPLIFDVYAEWNADLILSGHVHGGVIRLPFIGGLLSPERRFFPAYTRGLYHMDSSQLYVSAGLGKFRLFNPPEVNLITLVSKH